MYKSSAVNCQLFGRMLFGLMLLGVVLFGLMLFGLMIVQVSLAAPYPESEAIMGMTLDWSTHKRFAQSSDNFQLTWADDGNL